MRYMNYGPCHCGTPAMGEIYDGQSWAVYCEAHFWRAYFRDFLQQNVTPQKKVANQAVQAKQVHAEMDRQLALAISKD